MPQPNTPSTQPTDGSNPAAREGGPVERAFRSVLSSTPAIEGLILLDLQGAVLAKEGENEEVLSKLAPFGVGILDLVDRLATDAGRGELEYNMMKAEEGFVMLHQVGMEHMLFALADPDATLGVLLHDVEWCVERIAGQL
jgi:predicted regulator of Ras-like GTPase activity (Roadblock/LC7/MglB family)